MPVPGTPWMKKARSRNCRIPFRSLLRHRRASTETLAGAMAKNRGGELSYRNAQGAGHIFSATVPRSGFTKRSMPQPSRVPLLLLANTLMTALERTGGLLRRPARPGSFARASAMLVRGARRHKRQDVRKLDGKEAFQQNEIGYGPDAGRRFYGTKYTWRAGLRNEVYRGVGWMTVYA